MKLEHRLGWLVALALAGAVACGGEQHQAHHAGEHAGHDHAQGEKGHDHGHHDLGGPVGAFHEVIAPVWHSEKGPARGAKGCDAAVQMKERAAAIATAPAPDGANAATYPATTAALTAAVDALIAACAVDGRPDAEAKLSALHDAFHKVMDETPNGHHQHHPKQDGH